LRSEQNLREAQAQAEEMKAQEEELRQNMEELATSKEQMMVQHKQLQENEQAIRNIFDSSPFGVIRLSRQGIFIFYNEQVKQLLGISGDTALYFKNIFKVLSLERLTAGDKKRTKVFPTNGRPFMAEVIVSLLQDDFLLFLRDVTQEIYQQQELVKSLEQAEMLKQSLLERDRAESIVTTYQKHKTNGTSKR